MFKHIVIFLNLLALSLPLFAQETIRMELGQKSFELPYEKEYIKSVQIVPAFDTFTLTANKDATRLTLSHGIDLDDMRSMKREVRVYLKSSTKVYTLQLTLPKPEIQKINDRNSQSADGYDIWVIDWRTPGPVRLRISGKNFYPAPAGAILLHAPDNPADSIPVKLLEIDPKQLELNLELNARSTPGLKELSLRNLDGTKTTVRVFIEPLFDPGVSGFSEKDSIIVGKSGILRLKTEYPQLIEGIILQDENGKAAADCSKYNFKILDNTRIELNGTMYKKYNFYYNVISFKGKQPVLINDQSVTVIDNAPIFGPVQVTENQPVQGLYFPLQLFGRNDLIRYNKEYTMVNKEGKKIVFKRFGDKQFMIVSPQRLEADYNGYYEVQGEAKWKGEARIDVFEIPQVKAVSWKYADNKRLNNRVFARSKPQDVLVTLSLNKEYPADSLRNIKLFGLPITGPIDSYKKGRKRDRLEFPFRLPDTLKPGPVLMLYRQYTITGDLDGPALEIAPYSENALVDSQFVSLQVKTSRQGDAYFPLEKSEKEYTRSIRRKEDPELYLRFNDQVDYKAYGKQYLNLSAAVYDPSGNLQAGYSERLEVTGSKTIPLRLRPKGRQEVRYKIQPWDRVLVRLSTLYKSYDPELESPDTIRQLINFTSPKKFRFTAGTNIPLSIMGVLRQETKTDGTDEKYRLQSLTFNFGFNATWMKAESNGDLKGWGWGLALNATDVQAWKKPEEYKGFAVTGFYTLRLDRFTTDKKLILPLNLGLGPLFEWKNGISYVRPALLVQVGVNLGNAAVEPLK